MILTHLYLFFFGKRSLLFKPFLSDELKYKSYTSNNVKSKAECIDFLNPISKQKDEILFLSNSINYQKYTAEVSDV